MRRAIATIPAAILMTSSLAIADETGDARRLAVTGRDSYWNCLAREYPRDANRTMSEADFTGLIAQACASERQNFRTSLLELLTLQSPDAETGAHLATANRAIELAQQDIVHAFVKRKAAAK